YDYSVLAQMEYHDFFAGTQWPLVRYSFPPGVALRLRANKGFDLNSHYVNRTSSPMTGEVYVNLHYADPASVQHIADVMILGSQDFSLPPHQPTTVEKTFTNDVVGVHWHVFQMFSHAHEHMRTFKVFRAGGTHDGQLVYIATDWTHPPILRL